MPAIDWVNAVVHSKWFELFLIVFVAYVGLAGLLGFVGVRKIKQVKPPEKAIHQAKESKSLLKRG